jgi:hypothetical protein
LKPFAASLFPELITDDSESKLSEFIIYEPIKDGLNLYRDSFIFYIRL